MGSDLRTKRGLKVACSMLQTRGGGERSCRAGSYETNGGWFPEALFLYTVCHEYQSGWCFGACFWIAHPSLINTLWTLRGWMAEPASLWILSQLFQPLRSLSTINFSDAVDNRRHTIRTPGKIKTILLLAKYSRCFSIWARITWTHRFVRSPFYIHRTNIFPTSAACGM